MDISVHSDAFDGDDQSWIGSPHGTDHARSVTLDVSAFTKATHYPNGGILSGTPVGEITASGLYGPYDGAATDGRETLVGFVLTPTKVPSDGVTDVAAAVFEHGRVVEANLPIAIDAAAKADVAGSISFI